MKYQFFYIFFQFFFRGRDFKELYGKLIFTRIGLIVLELCSFKFKDFSRWPIFFYLEGFFGHFFCNISSNKFPIILSNEPSCSVYVF